MDINAIKQLDGYDNVPEKNKKFIEMFSDKMDEKMVKRYMNMAEESIRDSFITASRTALAVGDSFLTFTEFSSEPNPVRAGEDYDVARFANGKFVSISRLHNSVPTKDRNGKWNIFDTLKSGVTLRDGQNPKRSDLDENKPADAIAESIMNAIKANSTAKKWRNRFDVMTNLHRDDDLEIVFISDPYYMVYRTTKSNDEVYQVRFILWK